MSEHALDLSELRLKIAGSVLSRADNAYESTRRDLVWNGRKPDRFPDVLIRPESAQDVAHAVRFAKENGLRVGMRSGGHSWTASFLRDGGILLDMSAFDQVSIDAAAMTARVGPGMKGAKLIELLGQQGLFFPGGHCDTVGLGGFLLQGGYGWQARRVGPSCASILSAQVVTADGDILRIDADNHADLFWAMRGAGPGFFAAVTEFELKLIKRPEVLMQSTYIYDLDCVDVVIPCMLNKLPELSKNIECTLAVKLDEELGRPVLYVQGFAIADTQADAELALEAIDNCPVRDQAISSVRNQATSFPELYASVDPLYPSGMRIAVDNAWSDAKPEDLLPAIHAAIETMPRTLPGHLLLQPWGRTANLPDMAFSMEGNIFVLASSAWDDPAEDALHQNWVTESMKRFEPQAIGIKVGDENLASRPAQFMQPQNFARLQQIRQKWDSTGVFHSYMRLLPGV